VVELGEGEGPGVRDSSDRVEVNGDSGPPCEIAKDGKEGYGGYQDGAGVFRNELGGGLDDCDRKSYFLGQKAKGNQEEKGEGA